MSDLAAYGIALVRADNPGPLTLRGTNTWLTGGWVIDPGPALHEHLDAVAAAAGGGVEGVWFCAFAAGVSRRPAAVRAIAQNPMVDCMSDLLVDVVKVGRRKATAHRP